MSHFVFTSISIDVDTFTTLHNHRTLTIPPPSSFFFFALSCRMLSNLKNNKFPSVGDINRSACGIISHSPIHLPPPFALPLLHPGCLLYHLQRPILCAPNHPSPSLNCILCFQSPPPSPNFILCFQSPPPSPNFILCSQSPPPSPNFICVSNHPLIPSQINCISVNV